MKRISEIVDIELTKEETILLEKARILCTKLLIELKCIHTIKQPEGVPYVNDAISDITKVLGCFRFNDDNDEDIEKLYDEWEELYNKSQDPRNFY